MCPNPVLVEVTRGALVESQHRGAFAICLADGSILKSAGDIQRPIFPRSAIKLVQALPFIETGAAGAYGLGAEEMVLAASSHAGERQHTDRIEAWLKRLGLDAGQLQCGAHKPFSEAARAELLATGKPPTVLHNNNSGKHCAFLTTALFFEEPLAGYLDAHHPVQRRVKATVERAIGRAISDPAPALERCGMPAYPVSLTELARGMANLAEWSQRWDTASALLVSSIRRFPELLAGPKRLSTLICRHSDGEIIVKGGSEGVFSGLMPSKGLGLAMKIDDGAQRAADCLLVQLINSLFPGALKDPTMQKYASPDAKTYAGSPCGGYRISHRI